MGGVNYLGRVGWGMCKWLDDMISLDSSMLA